MIRLTFTGDLMALQPQNEASYCAENGRYDYGRVFRHVAGMFEESDYVIGNLETPIAGAEAGYTDNPTIFNTPCEFLDAVKMCGFSHVGLANNHILDRGIRGMVETMAACRKAGLDYSGVYENMDEADSVFIKDIKGVKIAVLSFTYGTNSKWRDNELPEDRKFIIDLLRKQDKYSPHVSKDSSAVRTLKRKIKPLLPQFIREKFSPVMTPACVTCEEVCDEPYKARMTAKIRKAKLEADVVIVCLHSGGQYNSTVDDYTRMISGMAADAGCDIVIVNHPHCVLEYTIHDGVPISYSLGNFCFTPGYGFWHDGVLAEYSVIENVLLDEESGKIRDISFALVKSVLEEDGNSVVYPVDVLYKMLPARGKKRLYKDCQKVLSRLRLGADISFDIERNEICCRKMA